MDIISSNSSLENNMEFRHTFTKFYKLNLRRNSEEWTDKYFALMQEYRLKDCSYKDILLELNKFSDAVEASFASKLLHTINPTFPILDSKVLGALGFKVYHPYKTDKCLRIYDEICSWYAEFLKSDICSQYLALFDKCFPNYTWITNIKKIDFFMWGIAE